MLAPLFALLRKDRPWIVVFAFAGLLTALGAVLFADPIDLLLFDYATGEATFWTALGGGLGLGAFAGVFDELLGTRELLWQRPVAGWKVAASRVAAVVSVLVVWQLAIPVVLLLLWWPLAESNVPLGLAAWREQQAAVAIAWPCAMVTLFAASLPLGWLSRLLSAGACFYVGMLVIDRASRIDGGQDPGVYLGTTFAVAALFAGLSLVSPGRRHDPDRPLASSLPQPTRWAIVIAMGLMGAVIGTEWEGQWIQGVIGSYPQPLLQEREVVLAVRTRNDRRHIVDHEHRVTAPGPVQANALAWPEGWPLLRKDTEFEQPHFLQSGRTAGRSWSGHAFHIASDGSAWLEQRTARFRRTFERIAIDDDVRLTRKARAVSGEGPNPLVIVVDPGAPQVWRLDVAARRLVAAPMPAGDRAMHVYRRSLHRLGLDAHTQRAWQAAIATAAERLDGKAPDPDRSNMATEVVCVRGELGSYAWVGDGLRPFSNEPVASQSTRVAQLLGDDPIAFRRSLPATSEHGGLAHDYEPRTFDERCAAAFAMACSSLRPPVLQVLAHSVSPNAAPGWLCDGLVVDGRRTWLVVLQLAVAALLAWRVRRWLQRHGVPANAWTWQIALFGVPAFLLFVYLERPRRVVAREVTPPAAPRITDASSLAPAN